MIPSATPFPPEPTTMAAGASRDRRRRIGFLALPAVLAPLFLWWVGVLGGNVREVEPGRLYRSAQLSHGTLARVVGEYGIRSVVNLRGAHPGEDAYDSERAICRARGIRHADFALSASRLPPPREIQGVVSELDRLPRPILVHCKAGADRTGLVSTLYANLYEGIPLDRAESQQRTWRYAHFAFREARAMDRFFDLYRRTARGEGLRRWIFDAYPKVYAGQVALHAPDVAPVEGGD